MKLKRLLCAAVLAGASLRTPLAHAQIAAPFARVFSNEGGQTMLKVVPDNKNMMGKPSATLTRFGDDGTEKVVWTKPLANLPGRVWLSNNWEPYVATTDSWGDAGSAHSIVIYDPKGEVVADLKGDDFLPKLPEPKPGEPLMIVSDGGGRNWSQNADISFEPRWNPTHFVVQLYDGDAKNIAMQTQDGTLTGAVRKRGDQIRVELKTGKLERLTGAQIIEAQIAAKQAPLQVAPALTEAPADAPRKELPRKSKGGEGTVSQNAGLAKQLRAVPETVADMKLVAELWRDLMPRVVRPGEKVETSPLMLVLRLQKADKNAAGFAIENFWVVNGDNVWQAAPHKADAGDEWNGRGGPAWNAGTNVDVIAEVRGADGKTLKVRHANAQIIGAM